MKNLSKSRKREHRISSFHVFKNHPTKNMSLLLLIIALVATTSITTCLATELETTMALETTMGLESNVRMI